MYLDEDGFRGSGYQALVLCFHAVCTILAIFIGFSNLLLFASTVGLTMMYGLAEMGNAQLLAYSGLMLSWCGLYFLQSWVCLGKGLSECSQWWHLLLIMNVMALAGVLYAGYNLDDVREFIMVPSDSFALRVFIAMNTVPILTHVFGWRERRTTRLALAGQ